MSSTSPDELPLTKVPRADVAEGRLHIERGLHGATIKTASGLGDLLHASWKPGPEPEVTVEGGEVTVRYRRFRRARPRSDEITLNAAVPWDISIHGRVHRAEVDLRGIRLRSLTIKGRASRSVILLGKPDRDVHLDLTSAERVTVRRPQETQVRVRITKGASQVVVDGQTYRAIGGETILTTGPIVRNDYHLGVTAAHRLRVTAL